jgi:hypothetical protein
MAKRKKVYISGPISIGDWDENFDQASDAHYSLGRLGFAPFNPMLSMKLPWCHNPLFSHEDWLEMDLPWVECADVLLRLPGESRGADREVAHAQEHGIPVYYNIKALIAEEGSVIHV